MTGPDPSGEPMGEGYFGMKPYTDEDIEFHARVFPPIHDDPVAQEQVDRLLATVLALRAQLEVERMRVVACDAVALADTPESAAKVREMRPEYRSAALESVIRRVDECMALRARAEGYRAALEELRERYDLPGHADCADKANCPWSETHEELAIIDAALKGDATEGGASTPRDGAPINEAARDLAEAVDALDQNGMEPGNHTTYQLTFAAYRKAREGEGR